MTLPAWPETLPAAPMLSGYGVDPDPGIARTQMESGYARQRRAWSTRRTGVAVRWTMTQAQMTAFRVFHDDDLAYGARFFTIALRLGEVDPRTVEARFVAAPRYAPAGPHRWQVSGQIEVRDPPLIDDEAIDVVTEFGYAETLAAAAALDGVTLLPAFVAWETGFGI